MSGFGDSFKAGGRVVKNVTGYDMHQLLAGSLGTLAVITRLNFRTSPMPPQERMFVAAFTPEVISFAGGLPAPDFFDLYRSNA